MTKVNVNQKELERLKEAFEGTLEEANVSTDSVMPHSHLTSEEIAEKLESLREAVEDHFEESKSNN